MLHEYQHSLDSDQLGWLPMAAHYLYQYVTRPYGDISYEKRGNLAETGVSVPAFDSPWTGLSLFSCK